jgi:hypothetical protein
MTNHDTPGSDKPKQLKPWQMGLAIGFLMAIVQPFNSWLLKQLNLVDTWTGMLVALPIMCISGIVMAIIWQRWL